MFMLLIGILVVLFAIFFISGKRFGVPISGLIMGSVLAEYWSSQLTPVLESITPAIGGVPTSVLAPIILIIIPALIMLSAAPAMKSATYRLVGGIIFAFLATAVLIYPLGEFAVMSDADKVIYDNLVLYKNQIVSIGVLVAVLDVVVGHFHKHKPAKEHDKKHH